MHTVECILILVSWVSKEERTIFAIISIFNQFLISYRDTQLLIRTNKRGRLWKQEFTKGLDLHAPYNLLNLFVEWEIALLNNGNWYHLASEDTQMSIYLKQR